MNKRFIMKKITFGIAILFSTNNILAGTVETAANLATKILTKGINRHAGNLAIASMASHLVYNGYYKSGPVSDNVQKFCTFAGNFFPPLASYPTFEQKHQGKLAIFGGTILTVQAAYYILQTYYGITDYFLERKHKALLNSKTGNESDKTFYESEILRLQLKKLKKELGEG